MISSLVDIMSLVDEYSSYVATRGILLDRDGFPLLHRNMFLEEWPDQLVIYRARKSKHVVDPSRTVLCFYCEDERIYPRLERVLNELSEYRRFMGVVSADVTVTADMDEEWQREIMLLNQLFMAVLAVNGVKVALNLRCGNRSSLSCFDSIPSNVMCASGTLGCEITETPLDMGYLEKIMRVRPSKVLIYGKSDSVMEDQLAIAGVPYRRYDDLHRISKRDWAIVSLEKG